MRKKYHRGFFAEKYLNELKQNEQIETFGHCHFIDDLDFFEIEKLNIIKEFNSANIEDEMFVAAQLDELC